MAIDSVLSRQQLLENLRNDTLVIPDLHVALEKWPQYVHPELDRLREDLEERLPKCVYPDFPLLRLPWLITMS